MSHTTRPVPKSRPRAALDAGVDPADLTPQPLAQPVTAVPVPVTPAPSLPNMAQPVVQLSIRITPGSYQALEMMSTRSGRTKRDLIEEAIALLEASGNV